MFTGIVTEIGKIESVKNIGKGLRIIVAAPETSKELQVNDSVSINGACQTVISKTKFSFEVQAVEETIKKTTFGFLKKGEKVNLELSMKLNDRLGGHLVSGHVDCVGEITAVESRTLSLLFTIKIPKEFKKYVISVGSISIDGVSLTIADIYDDLITVSIIPHTLENTIFKYYKVNNKVNLEFDLIGKYIENMMTHTDSGKKKLTIEKLIKSGY